MLTNDQEQGQGRASMSDDDLLDQIGRDLDAIGRNLADLEARVDAARMALR